MKSISTVFFTGSVIFGHFSFILLNCHPEFDRVEAETALASLSLSSLASGGHLVVMRDSFDVRLAGEPYHALMLLLDVRSGRYMARIWNRTEFRGEAVTLDQLTEACRRHFFSGRPCVGYPEDEDEQGSVRESMLPCHVL